ncbi:MAG: GNAT family N-acetyltransferase, partial [Chloroflexi bacterium]|nr:GNAT family N-acetyltransferase [Chloroflexota bacterium]
AQLGWQQQVEQLQHSPYIPLPGQWETYLESIDKKQRHEVRRKMRRFEQSEVPTRWYYVEARDGLEDEIEAFLDLMRHDDEKAAFLSDAMQEHMRLTIRWAFEAGCLHLAFLEVNGQKAAGYLSFDYLNRLWVYNSGMDPSFRDYSPGWVLLGYLLQWANQQGYQAFDFMRGDEEYKYRFGAVDRFVMRATLTPPQ